MRGSLRAGLTGLLVATGTVVTAPAGAVPVQPVPVSVTVVGHGWGHGRGLGQWGALGYAVDHGWSSAAILHHYYGGTRPGRVGNTPVAVELTRYEGAPVTVTGRALRVAGRAFDGAVRIDRVGSGRFRVSRGSSCGGRFHPWFTASGVTLTGSRRPADPASAVQVCSADETHGYRGSLRVFDGGGATRVTNVLPLESYLKGVMPREVVPAWGDRGRGRGVQALRAQAVAARSYVLASRRAWATTCDTTACQVYDGWFTIRSGKRRLVEDPRTSAAVNATAGLVRTWPTGAVALTEFGSSSGGYTAGGPFPAVPDGGDAIADNPRHDWTRTFTWADLSARLGCGRIVNVTVARREHVGRTATRAALVRITSENGRNVVIPGREARRRLGLPSAWFSFLQHRPRS